MLLTTEVLFHFQRCRRRAFLDFFGDANQRDPEPEFLLKLQKDSWAHRHATVAQMTYCQPDCPPGDWDAGAAATLKLMRLGVERIYMGVLATSGPEGLTLVSYPDLLVKLPGESCFGDWLYVPADIRLGRRPKLDYQIVAAFHAFVLESVQGGSPPSAGLLLRDKGIYWVNLAQRVPQMQQLLRECAQMLRRHIEPEVFISRHPCSLCHWASSCTSLAKETKHLSLLPGVTPSRYAKLRALNLTSVGALAGADPQVLEPLPEFAGEVARQVVLQAQAALQDRALAKRENGSFTGTFPTAPVEFYFDIEAQPELDLVFLHGVLEIDRHANTQKFHPLLAKQPSDEGAIWEKFLDVVWAHPDAPVFHFCDYEVQTVKQLAKRYRTPAHLWLPLLSRFVDVHEWVTRNAVLPVDSYALKSIARWLGFQWRAGAANGGHCVVWYDQWLETGNPFFLDAILSYNEDDCRATHLVKDWLASFLLNRGEG
ncbi:TM0106 family RecB-like putative nuclease [Kamptonema formosum]|uniref:TM0106 family RecB-like putative nuclease n=1 Tax=Kamptonema formosum TaxID=331992 RepID=UPI00034AE313|nr:TM0106 family RecB-like putative nuclease [Oscillatoria sp. PCC 10802]